VIGCLVVIGVGIGISLFEPAPSFNMVPEASAAENHLTD
jgi:hypothetical protein